VHFAKYVHIPGTDVCPHVAEYSAIAFDCTLSGPFDKLHYDPALTFPDSLCVHENLYLRFIGLFSVLPSIQ
jgi:hypothetical protein